MLIDVKFSGLMTAFTGPWQFYWPGTNKSFSRSFSWYIWYPYIIHIYKMTIFTDPTPTIPDMSSWKTNQLISFWQGISMIEDLFLQRFYCILGFNYKEMLQIYIQLWWNAMIFPILSSREYCQWIYGLTHWSSCIWVV